MRARGKEGGKVMGGWEGGRRKRARLRGGGRVDFIECRGKGWNKNQRGKRDGDGGLLTYLVCKT